MAPSLFPVANAGNKAEDLHYYVQKGLTHGIPKVRSNVSMVLVESRLRAWLASAPSTSLNQLSPLLLSGGLLPHINDD